MAFIIYKIIKLYTHIAQLERALALARGMGLIPIVRPVDIRLYQVCFYYYIVTFIHVLLLFHCIIFIIRELQKLLMDQM